MQLKEIRLQTKHLLPLYYFYRDLLELPVNQQKKKISILAGESTLVFEETNKKESPFYHFAFNIPSNKIDEAMEWICPKLELLKLEEYNSVIADFVTWNAKSFYFKDPAGNIVEMIARNALKDNIEAPFQPKHIRNISEIGIVFSHDTFDKEVKALLDQYQLSYFDKQPPMPYFRAIGNDEGLLIAVPENRGWFSSPNDKAQIFPVQILFLENGRLFDLKM